MKSIARLIACLFACLGPGQDAYASCRTPAIAGPQGKLSAPSSPSHLGCERPFLIRGELYSVDSPQAQDASNLRNFVKSVPEADELLDTYQARRERSRLSAYTGTIGVLMIILAGTVFKRAETPGQESLKSALRYGGAGLTLGGFAYSYSLLRTNELLIPEAVKRYNEARPTDPIELKFEAGWSF